MAKEAKQNGEEEVEKVGPQSALISTIAMDAFTRAEAGEVARAITYLCSPFNNIAWSSCGVYLFWDHETAEILYIGYSNNLGRRFCEHLGFVPCDPGSCKINEIEEYFGSRKKLGVTLILQGNAAQPQIGRNAKMLTVKDEDGKQYSFAAPTEPVEIIESRLIAGFLTKNNAFPRWNKKEGCKEGRAQALPHDHLSLDIMTGKVESCLIARSRIREIAVEESLTLMFEYMRLDPIRFLALNSGEHPDNAWASAFKFQS